MKDNKNFWQVNFSGKALAQYMETAIVLLILATCAVQATINMGGWDTPPPRLLKILAGLFIGTALMLLIVFTNRGVAHSINKKGSK